MSPDDEQVPFVVWSIGEIEHRSRAAGKGCASIDGGRFDAGDPFDAGQKTLDDGGAVATLKLADDVDAVKAVKRTDRGDTSQAEEFLDGRAPLRGRFP